LGGYLAGFQGDYQREEPEEEVKYKGNLPEGKRNFKFKFKMRYFPTST